jgi:hypothetical protein
LHSPGAGNIPAFSTKHTLPLDPSAERGPMNSKSAAFRNVYTSLRGVKLIRAFAWRSEFYVRRRQGQTTNRRQKNLPLRPVRADQNRKVRKTDLLGPGQDRRKFEIRILRRFEARLPQRGTADLTMPIFVSEIYTLLCVTTRHPKCKSKPQVRMNNHDERADDRLRSAVSELKLLLFSNRSNVPSKLVLPGVGEVCRSARFDGRSNRSGQQNGKQRKKAPNEQKA